MKSLCAVCLSNKHIYHDFICLSNYSRQHGNEIYRYMALVDNGFTYPVKYELLMNNYDEY